MGFEVIVDYKKSCKDIYLPKTEPSLITLPPIAYAAVKGTGDPNTSKAYKEALELLYGLLYTIKRASAQITHLPVILIMSCRRWRAYGKMAAN